MKNLPFLFDGMAIMKWLKCLLTVGILLFSGSAFSQASIQVPAPAVYFAQNGERFLDGDAACKYQEYTSYYTTFFNGRYGVDPSYGQGCFFDTLNWATGVYGTTPAYFQYWVLKYGYCPIGFLPNVLTTVGNPCSCTDQKLCPTQPRAGPVTCRPVCIGTGMKFFSDADAALTGGRFRFAREYNSQSTAPSGNTGSLGDPNWRTVLDSALLITEVSSTSAVALASRPDGQVLIFRKQGSGWLVDLAKTEILQEIVDGSGIRTGWLLTTDSLVTESYSTKGQLTGMTWPDGYQVTFTFGNKGLATAIGDSYGRTLTFEYDAGFRLTKMTDMSGAATLYAYDDYQAGSYHYLLKSVTYPDGKTKNYLYESGACRNAVTGITDENGSRYLTVTYSTDGNCRVIAEETNGGTNKFTFDYSVPNTTTVVDPLGAARSYGKSIVQWVDRSTGVSLPCAGCAQATTYDGNGNIESRTDWNNNKTCYWYDTARNLETRRVEGLSSSASCASYQTGTPALTAPARMTSTVWSTDWRLPVQIAESLRITTYTYGSPNASNPGDRGNVLSRTVQATTDATGAQGLAASPTGSPRVSAMTYDANGSVTSVKGPRTDLPANLTDTTVYTYWDSNDADLGKRGNVKTVTNALSHTTTINTYNAHGQPTGITAPNDLTTALEYDSRQRLTKRTVGGSGGEITSYTYDGVGQLTKVTLPDNSFITYTYDGAHRLTGMADNQDNRIAYTLDLMGNRTKEEVFDPANQLKQTRSREYNALNRLIKDIGAQNQTTQYAYDTQGNLTQVTDPLSRSTSNTYDALNRLIAMTQPAVTLPGGGTGTPTVAYVYDGLDQLVKVTDPNNHHTLYTYDGLGNQTQQTSPDTGVTSTSYDAAGNVLTRTDAAGRISTYTYDPLNRVLSASHAQSGQATVSYAYSYDQDTNGTGRLTGITETSAASGNTAGSITYGYDQHGRVTSETRLIAGASHTTGYQYDNSNGRLTGITYPGGRIVNYSFDPLGRITGISTRQSAGAAAQTVVNSVTYHPFRSDAGGITGFTLGNGRIHTRSVDLDGRIASYSQAGQAITIGYDAASNITGIGTNNYAYDSLNRLTSANAGAAGSYGYAYDATGNRVQTTGPNQATLTVDNNNNRLTSIQTSTATRTMQYDAAGAITGDGNAVYGYDVRNRMVSATAGGNTTQYEINALGERVRKSTGANGTTFHYDRQGKLIAETNAQGQVVREIIYLLDLPVGVMQ